MWGCDFPHHDSVWPNSQETLEMVFEGMTDDVRRITTLDKRRQALWVVGPRMIHRIVILALIFVIVPGLALLWAYFSLRSL